jgi:hypothetical protein
MRNTSFNVVGKVMGISTGGYDNFPLYSRFIYPRNLYSQPSCNTYETLDDISDTLTRSQTCSLTTNQFTGLSITDPLDPSSIILPRVGQGVPRHRDLPVVVAYPLLYDKGICCSLSVQEVP